jgi:hypothetical protein
MKRFLVLRAIVMAARLAFSGAVAIQCSLASAGPADQAASPTPSDLHEAGLWQNQTFLSIILCVLVAVVAIGVARFLWWVRFKANLDVDNTVRCWELFFKGALAVGGVLALLRYVDTRQLELEHERNDLAQRTREFNVNLYGGKSPSELRMQLYNEAVDVASTIATSSDGFDSPEVRIALKRFERLYWGQMGIDEEDPVDKAMRHFRGKLVELKVLKPLHGDLQPAAGDDLQHLSILLAHACRTELEQAAKTNPAFPRPDALQGKSLNNSNK